MFKNNKSLKRKFRNSILTNAVYLLIILSIVSTYISVFTFTNENDDSNFIKIRNFLSKNNDNKDVGYFKEKKFGNSIDFDIIMKDNLKKHKQKNLKISDNPLHDSNVPVNINIIAEEMFESDKVNRSDNAVTENLLNGNVVNLDKNLDNTDTSIKTNLIPLCLISTWERSKLPNYAELFFNSISRQKLGLVKLFFFHHEIEVGLRENLDNTTYKNLEFIDISDLNTKYKEGGFPNFAADKICSIFGEEIESFNCKRLYAAIQWSQFRGENSPPIVQLRGMYGKIFEEWIGPNKCETWAWTDLDIVFGNLDEFLTKNKEKLSEVDVFTISGTDYTNLYTRGQFTGHNQIKNSELTNNIWRGCEYLNSLENIVQSFLRKGFCMDEGCYGKAVVEKTKSGLKYGIFPFQGNAWDLKGVNYINIIDGNLYTGSSCFTLADCKSMVSNVVLRKNLSKEKHVLLSNSDEVEKITMGISSDIENCSWWIEKKFKSCIKDTNLIPENVKNVTSKWNLIVYDGVVDMHIIDQHDIGINVAEVIFFHIGKWKKSINFEFENNEFELFGPWNT
ncbi:hypothetical protein HDU92_002103 [Lobulomyces angularis]|nr:hypothetical protein HDU92_002103 [Lobulomyces angularis]